MTSPLEQCRDVLKPCPFCGAKPGTLARPDNIDGSEFYAAVFCHCEGYSATAHAGRRGKTQDEATSAAHAAWNRRAAAEAALAAQPEPVAWAQLGMRNGHTYVRMHYEGHLYPPPPDVQRNLNLVPLYAAPVAVQPLPERLVAFALRDLKADRNRLDGFLALGNETRRAAEYDEWIAALEAYCTAHGIAPKEPA